MEGRLSAPRQMGCGVPQGSILGPPLFICYINDLPRQCTKTNVFVYAGDTALLVTGPNPEYVQNCLQSDLNRLNVWFNVNKLSINCAKSNTILFTSQWSKYKDACLDVTIANDSIAQVKEVKYLGLYINNHLSFDSHIHHLCNKLNVRTKLLWRIRGFISRELSCTLYRALIEPHIHYCTFILKGTTQGNLHKLQVQQNCALHSVMKIDPYFSAETICEELGFDSVVVLMKKACCKFAYKGYYDLGPPSLNSMFEVYICERELCSNEQLISIVP